MNVPLVLPILVPLLATAVSLLAWGSRRIQRALALLAAVIDLLIAAALLLSVYEDGIRVEQIGGWPAPYGITLVADLFGAIMILLGSITALAVVVYSVGSMNPERESYGYYPLFNVLVMGVNGAFLTGDLFNLYVWFEVMLMASFVLLALGGERRQLEGSIKYVTINIISSAILLTGIGIVYGVFGTLSMADLARKVPEADNPAMVTALSMLFFVAFGIKAGVFPLFYWLPASYHTPPIAVAAIFSGLLTKVGIYALIRVFTLIFIQDVGLTHTLILAVAGLTMVTGVLGAVAHFETPRILSFHIISQIGYMLMGLGLFTPVAIAGSIFYIVHHMIVKTNLFLLSGVMHRFTGTHDLNQAGGLYKSRPALGALFLIPALSLAGSPPLSGFFAKFYLIKGGFEADSFMIVGVALAVSLLTLYSMTKIWSNAFWKSAGDRALHRPSKEERTNLIFMVSPIVGLSMVTLAIGFGAEPVSRLALQASEQLFEPQLYIETVLGVQE
jgi:multicomponent Na+:H+ antiporter subunit D